MTAYPLSYAEFREGLAQGRLLGLKCTDCGEVLIPPGAVCPGCGGSALEVKSFVKRGWLKTFTVVRVAPVGMSAPYIVAMVELEEGGWVVGNLLGVDPDELDAELMNRPVEIGHRLLSAAESGGPIDGAALTFTLSQ